MRSELYLNGVRVDLKEEIESSLNLMIADIRDPKSHNGSYSKTIKLPASKTINKLLGGIFDIAEEIQTSGVINFSPDFNPNLKCSAILYADGLEQFNGNMKLISIDRDQQTFALINYNVQLYGEVANIYSAIGDNKLSDLDFSDLNHTYNKATQKATWTNVGTGAGYVYPMINYGGVPLNDWAVENFYPAIYLKDYVDRIFAQAGYTYTCPFFTSSYFKSLIVPFAGEKLTITSTQATNRLFSSHTSVATSGIASAVDPIIFNVEDSDPSGQYNNATGYFTASNSGYYQFFSSGVVTYDAISTVTGTGLSTFNIQLILTRGASTFTYPIAGDSISTFATYTSGQTIKVFNFIGWSQQLLLLSGDTIRIKCAPSLTGLSGTVGQRISSNATFFNRVSDTAIVDGGTLDMASALPTDIKQADLFSSVLRTWNLYCEPDKTTPNNLIIDTYDDFYGSGSVRDWTLKVDCSKTMTITPMGALDSRRYVMKYSDDTDYWNKYYKDKWGETYGQKNLDIVNDFLKNVYVNEVIFASTPSIGDSSNDRIIPEIYSLANSGVQTQIRSKLRILFWEGALNTTTGWNYNSSVSGTSVETTYPYCGHIDNPITPTKDLSFGVPREIYYLNPYGQTIYTNDNIYNSYHAKFLSEITDTNSKIVELYVRLRPLDINTLSFRDLIFIDGQYYRLQKVIDYNPIAETVTKIELLKIKSGIPFTPATKSLTFTHGEMIDGLTPAPSLGGSVAVGDVSALSLNSSVGVGNYISRSASAISIVGNANRIGNNAQNISIHNSSGIVIADGLKNVSVINSKDITITDSNVNYINSKLSGDILFDSRLFTVAELLAFGNTPISFIPGVSGYYINPVSGWIESDFINGISNAYTHTTSIAVYNNGATNPLFQDLDMLQSILNRNITLRPFYVSTTSDTQLISGADLMVSSAVGLVDNPLSGDFQIKIHIFYQLISSSF